VPSSVRADGRLEWRAAGCFYDFAPVGGVLRKSARAARSAAMAYRSVGGDAGDARACSGVWQETDCRGCVIAVWSRAPRAAGRFRRATQCAEPARRPVRSMVGAIFAWAAIPCREMSAGKLSASKPRVAGPRAACRRCAAGDDRGATSGCAAAVVNATRSGRATRCRCDRSVDAAFLVFVRADPDRPGDAVEFASGDGWRSAVSPRNADRSAISRHRSMTCRAYGSAAQRRRLVRAQFVAPA
jgi:hypothetical protein